MTPCGCRKIGQEVLAERNREVAALRDRHRVRERLGEVGKRRGHFRLRLEILLGRERPRPARVGEDIAAGNADARLVRAKIVAPQELHRMRGDDRQRELGREPHGRGHQRVVVGATRALHFEVVAPRKETRPRARGLRRAAGVALQERAADLAVARARKRDQPVGAFLQPVALQFRAAAMLIGPVRARQPFGEPQVSGARLREQQRAERLIALGLVRQPDVAPDDGLDAGARAAR